MNNKIDIKASYQYYSQANLPYRGLLMKLMCRFVVNKNKLEFIIMEIPLEKEVEKTINTQKPLINEMYNTSNVEVANSFNNAWDNSTYGGAESGGGVIGNVVSGIGFAGSVTSYIDGTFRLAKSGSISPAYYSTGWNTGNQYVKNLYNVSKIGSRVATGASMISTGMAYNEILNGSPQAITYADATVGSLGLSASFASYLTGVQIPVVGEFVAIYGVMRLTWDVFFYLGQNHGLNTWFKQEKEQPKSRVLEYMRKNGMFEN